MTMMKLTLYGSKGERQQARGILENHPSVRRVDTLDTSSSLRLMLSKSIPPEEIVSMLACTGLVGVQIDS